MGLHALPSEQGTLSRPSLPRHLCQCTICSNQAEGKSVSNKFVCPHFGAIRDQFSSLFQDAEGSDAFVFMWHRDQKAASHCLTAILQMAQT